MNRADRRAARRAQSRQHAGCGCIARLLTPVERHVTCQACGHVVPTPESFVLPTTADAGSLKPAFLGCACGQEVQVLCLVEHL